MNGRVSKMMKALARQLSVKLNIPYDRAYKMTKREYMRQRKA